MPIILVLRRGFLKKKKRSIWSTLILKSTLSKINQTELFLIFLKLGFIGFGGPVAHIALMHAEFVSKRQWPEDGEFFDMVGATNLIPGPNSTVLALHIGLKMGDPIGPLLVWQWIRSAE